MFQAIISPVYMERILVAGCQNPLRGFSLYLQALYFWSSTVIRDLAKALIKVKYNKVENPQTFSILYYITRLQCLHKLKIHIGVGLVHAPLGHFLQKTTQGRVGRFAM